MNSIAAIPYLTPQLLIQDGAAVLPAIAKLIPSLAWATKIVALIPAPAAEVALLQVVCDKINAFTQAQPPAVSR